MNDAVDSTFVWRRALLRSGRLGKRIGLTTTGGRAGAAAARLIDRPSRPIGRAAALFDQFVTCTNTGPRVPDPLACVEGFLRTLPVAVDGMAFMHSSTPGRCVVAVSVAGAPRYVLKIGSLEDLPLRNEAEFLGTVSGAGFPFRIPSLVSADITGDRFVMVTHAWVTSHQAGLLSRRELLNITQALAEAGNGGPVVHGDLAPWNVLRTPAGLGIVDWERATLTGRPMTDLIHYLVQAGSHLRWFDTKQVVQELTHPHGTLAQLAHRLGYSSSLVEQALQTYFTSLPAAGARRVRQFRDSVASAVGVSGYDPPGVPLPQGP
ncbi:phosphotransferase [Streptomyces sp. MK7]|uniref:phosphotransferase n=1 Tax=Streptomyces sp. MK7 TaxID=3067635 RepID=UPI00292D24F8|nr:phosphotransferase [Streptomyces sp. MK7]